MLTFTPNNCCSFTKLLIQKTKTLILLAVFAVSSFSVFAQTTSLISDCSDFISGPTAWPYVLVATTPDSGTASQGAQTFTMNVINLPSGGATFRVAKTVANGNWFFGPAQTMTLGSNSITVAAVTFNRSVKFQFSTGDVEFDALVLNGDSSDCVIPPPPSLTSLISDCNDFISGPTAWPYVLEAVNISAGAISQGAQTFTMNVTNLPPGGATFRVAKTTANGNWYFGPAQTMTLGSNGITVPAVTFNRTVKFQFSTGDVEFDALSLNGVASNCVIPPPPPTTSLISDCNDFTSGPTAWPYVLVATTPDSGVASQGVQTFTMNVTDTANGATFRVAKTVANGNWFFGPAQTMTLGSNSITVPAVTFNRSVKFQFSSGDVEFDALTLNGIASSCVSIQGCTDSLASNYDSLAIIDDGSCVYCIYADSAVIFLTGSPSGYYTMSDSVTIPAGVTSITLDLRAGGDLNNTGEYFNVYFNGVQYGGDWNTGMQDCNLWDLQLDDTVTSLFNIGSSNLIEVTQSSNVDNFGDCSPPSAMTAEFTLNYTGGDICGCMDSLALNYDSLAVFDDGSCCYVSGCMDPIALNYDSTACFDDGSCILPIYGCTDSLAFNYDFLANVDDGSCCYVSGCMDPIALNYDSTACFDDGSCILPIYGCTDSLAFNYDSLANVDDGSCCYVSGCMDPIALNYDSTACFDDGSCMYIPGCTDSLAFNYDSLATLDDGSCVYCDLLDSITFNYTGAVQTYVVPSNINSVTIKAYGAEGGGRLLSGNTDSGLGGLGGYSVGDLAVTPGDTLKIYVGGHGLSSTSGLAAGGWNGGGSGYASQTYEPGNGGGGASDVRLNGDSLTDRVIVAAGGGGGGEDPFDQYGDGGGFQGTNSYYPGTQTGAGAGGGLGYGGSTGFGDGGGGGGGYYGGGTIYSTGTGGDTQGGGGGSSYIGGVTNANTIAAQRSGNGLIVIYYDVSPCYGCMDSLALNYDSLVLSDDGSCCYVSGCMDSLALNYDSTACFDDGSCILPIYGCTNSLALNYDSLANVDDGSCCYVSGCIDPIALNYDSTACFDDGSCMYIPGCTDPLAGNYDSLATMDDGSCIYCGVLDSTVIFLTGSPSGYYTMSDSVTIPAGVTSITLDLRAGGDLNSGGEHFNVYFNGVQYGGDWNTGMQDCNLWDLQLDDTVTSLFNIGSNLIEVTQSNQVDDLGNCFPPSAMIAEFTLNYTGSDICGCMDSLALNYDSLAVFDDGSCCYVSGCMDPIALNYDSIACFDDGSCMYIPGCTDPSAGNYDSLATMDDGSCIYCDDSDSTVIFLTGSPSGYYTMSDLVIIPSGATSITLDLRAGGDLNGGSEYFNVYFNGVQYGGDWYTGMQDCNLWDLQLDDTVTSLLNIGSNIIEVTQSNQVDDLGNCSPPSAMIAEFTFKYVTENTICGCMDSLALNYDSLVLVDDGSCCYAPGCIDPIALNYDSTACFDDGSCMYIPGCTDPLAGNYDSLATMDDGSCIYCISTDSTTFNYTGAVQTYVVPSNINSVTIKAYGAEGGGRLLSGNTYSGLGGLGGYSVGDLAVTPGDTLNIYVGGHGLTEGIYGVAPGGWNGGGSGHCSSSGEPGNGGGGASDVRLNGNSLTDRVIVAAGGGGGGEDYGDSYGDGGGFEGTNSYYPGTQTGAGTGGGLGYGGSTGFGDGGGGGGGYYGGGTFYGSSVGTDTQGGGGGSSYIGGVTNANTIAAQRSGNGLIIIYALEDTCSFGCIDSLALNYDSTANIDDGSCIYCTYGCTDPLAFNYDSLANCDDGSCVPFVYGCTDTTAINYYSGANTDDGSCIYAGCTDSNAINYDPIATVDDGSCTYCSNPAPTGLTVDWVTDIKAGISWDNMNDSSCMVWKYYVRYREVGTPNWTTKSAGVGNGLCNFGLNTTTKTLQLFSINNTYGTTYEFKMKAFYCGGTESNYSAPVQFTTKPDCPPMTNLTATTFNGNQAKVRFDWDTTGVNYGWASGAYVFARVALRVDTAGANWQTAGGFGVYYPTFYVNKFGLQPGESYRAQGRTFCDSNITSYRSWWTSPIFWTQPGSIRMNGGTAINNLDVYPNPTRDIFNVSFVSEEIQTLSIRVMNIVGEVIYEESLEEFVGEYTKQISLKDYSKGVYFLEINDTKGTINKKIILQ